MRPPTEATTALIALLRDQLRAPSEWSEHDDGRPYLVFDPPLTADEELVLERLKRVAASYARISPAEYAAIEGDIAGLRAYYNLASPTNAQSVAAIKSIIAVLRALLRD